MRDREATLDREILACFSKTLSALHVSDDMIYGTLYDMELPELDAAVREQLSGDGLELAEHFDDSQLEIVEFEQRLTYAKRFVVLYIRDQYLRQEKYEREEWKPFHICWCSALQEAKAQHRYEDRYVMTYSTSGNFKVNLFVRDYAADGLPFTLRKEQGVYRKLRVCQSCLYQLNWKGFRQHCGKGIQWWKGGNPRERWKISAGFDLEAYFRDARIETQRQKEQDALYAHPVVGTGQSATRKEYVLTPSIKEHLKKLVGYTCEICQREFDARDLQIHHKNHNEGDNRRENLLVVCQACHHQIHEIEGGFTNPLQSKADGQGTKPRPEIKKGRIDISEQEYAVALERLSRLYGAGLGVERDQAKEAIYRDRRKEVEAAASAPAKQSVVQQNLCKLRAEMGDATAYYDFAELLRTSGKDVALDGDSGRNAGIWYQKAAAYYEGIVEEYEITLSPASLQSKAAAGSEPALRRLTEMAESGNVDAMLALADLYS